MQNSALSPTTPDLSQRKRVTTTTTPFKNEKINKQVVLGEEYLHLKRRIVEVQQVEKYSVFSISPYSNV